MLNRLLAMLPVLLLMLLTVVPVAFGQETAAEDNTQRNQFILGALAVLIIFIYFRRRKKRKGLE